MQKYRAENFSLKQEVASALSKHLPAFVYTSRQGPSKGLKRKGGLGFIPGGPDTEETLFLRTLDFTGKCVYDIGGFQGLLTIFFAKSAKQVITYEANPLNAARIYENAALNRFDHVLVRLVAVGSSDGLLKLRFDYPFDGAASGDPEIAGHMMESGADVREFTAVMTTLDNDIARFGLQTPDFVKIDIEGMEIEALRGMAGIIERHRPALYLELHGTTPEDKRANAADAIAFIRDRGYEIYDVEQKRVITNDVPTGRESHIYCKARG